MTPRRVDTVRPVAPRDSTTSPPASMVARVALIVSAFDRAPARCCVWTR